MLSVFKGRLERLKRRAAGQPGRFFMPRGSVATVFTEEELLEALTESALQVPSHKRSETAAIIVNRASLIFAVLVELNLEHALLSFIENDCYDGDLPLEPQLLKNILPDASTGFERLQWEYLPYIFVKTPYNLRIRDERVLPYLEESKIGGGGFSVISKVLIHAKHHTFTSSAEHLYLVRKTLLPPTRLSERQIAESELLFLLGNLKHPNFVELLFSYTLNGVTNLLFHPAEMDLHEFLLRPERLRGFEEQVVVFQALHGLSSALSYLHKFRFVAHKDTEITLHGYHHDLKPRNVLIRNKTFVLADFGHSKLKHPLLDTQTSWKYTTFEYGAPECRDPQTLVGGKVGRALDVWSLACVMSEVLVYVERGSPGVIAFRDARLQEAEYGLVRCFHDGDTLYIGVVNYLNELKSLTSSAAAESAIDLFREMVRSNPKARPDASAVEVRLSYIEMEELVNALDSSIRKCFDLGDELVHRNLLQTKLTLELNRLSAWAVALGLKKLRSRRRKWDQQAYLLHAEIVQSFKSALDRINKAQRCNDANTIFDVAINILSQTNDSLCARLSAETISSIDELFRLIAISTRSERPLKEIADFVADEPPYGEAKTVPAIKLVSLLIEKHSRSPVADRRIEPYLIEEGDREQDLSVHPHIWQYHIGLEKSETRKVIIEFMPYLDRKNNEAKAEEFQAAVTKMFDRVQDLVSMLMQDSKPDDLRVLDCLGTFHDIQRRAFGIVYSFPSEDVEPVRLHKLLRYQKLRPICPELSSRLALAKTIVASVQSVHAAGWLHNYISSKNIVFFHKNGLELTNLDLKQPFLIGFDHSCKHGAGELSQGPALPSPSLEYLHPMYRLGNAEADESCDYYSLGLVLLEIGLWSTISNIYERDETVQPDKLREKYIESCREHLGSAMGSTYKNVVLACLQYSPNDPTTVARTSLERELDFQTRVMDKLETCVF